MARTADSAQHAALRDGAGVDDLVTLAARLLATPLAVLVIDGGESVGAAVGPSSPWTDRLASPLWQQVCREVIEIGAPVLVEDSGRPRRISDGGAARRLGLEAYLAVPLVAGDGEVLGALCAADDRRRSWSAADLENLITVARSMVGKLESRVSERARADQRIGVIADLAPVGIFETDARGSCLIVNRRWSELTGMPAERARGLGWIDALHPDDRERVGEEWARAATAGCEFVSEHRLLHPDGRVVPVIGRAVPLHGPDGAPTGFLGAIVDLTDRKAAEGALERERLYESERSARGRAEIARRRSERLGELAGALAEAATVEEVAEVLAVRGADALGAPAAEVLVVDDALGHLERAAVRGPLGGPRPLTRGATHPAAAALRTDETVLAGRDSAWADPPELRAAAGVELTQLAAVPLSRGGVAIGVLVYAFLEPTAEAADRIDLLTAVAELAAPALERARLHGSAERARLRAEAWETLSRGLATAADLDEVVATVADHAGATVGALFSNVALADPEAERLRLRHGPALDRAVAARWPEVPAGHATPASDAVRTGVPVIVPNLERLASRYPNLLDDARTAGFQAMASLPLRGARGAVLGAVGFSWASPPVATDSLMTTLHAVSDLCAQAVERARLHEREHHIAEILQRDLLPSGLPAVPGLELSARYLAAGEGNQVGGDFYDVLPAEGGWAIVIGDVCGKGPEGARLTALCRHTIRAAVLRDERDPGEVLALLNRAMLAESDDLRFCSAIFGHLTLGAGRLRVRLASAGHPPPLVVRADRRVEPLEPRGGLLGVWPDGRWADVEATLRPGDGLVLYTDGVVEARRGPEIFGEARLRALVAANAAVPPQRLLAMLEERVRTFNSGPLRDDVALLGLRYQGQEPVDGEASAS